MDNIIIHIDLCFIYKQLISDKSDELYIILDKYTLVLNDSLNMLLEHNLNEKDLHTLYIHLEIVFESIKNIIKLIESKK